MSAAGSVNAASSTARARARLPDRQQPHQERPFALRHRVRRRQGGRAART
ncbi:hypothetical protein [Streptomyces sp. NPDC054783]